MLKGHSKQVFHSRSKCWDMPKMHRGSQGFWFGRGPNHKLHAMASSQTSKEEFLWGQRYCRMEGQKPWPGVGTSLGTRSKRGLKPIAKTRKCLNWETCLSKEVYCNANVSQTGFWGPGGEAPSRWAIFRNFLEKSHFNTIGSHFARIQSHLKVLDF